MSNPNTNADREVRINVEYGLHLRPAELFARTATRFVSEIRVIYMDKGEQVNGKSLLDLITLAAECGAVLKIEAQGPDAELAVETLSRLVESDFRGDAASTSSHAV
jgi:phosphotransferase system HPr (HPr) family protein